MKRHYLWIAATATVLAGCTNTDILRDTISEGQSELITFDTYHSGGTKAPVYNETNLTTGNGGFGVFAYKHQDPINITGNIIDLSEIADEYTNPVFDNTLTWYNENYDPTTTDEKSIFFTKYQYEFPRYWDKQMNYTFFAYAPHADKMDDATNTKGVYLNPATGLIKRNDIHKIQSATSSTNKDITNGTVTRTRAQYIVNDANIKDYLLAPCVPGQRWHNTNRTIEKTNPDYWKNSEITVGFIFHHMLSQLNVNINAKNEEYSETDAEKKGHEYKGIKSIYVTKLEITNLPSLADLDANYIECEQTMANFTSIYKYTTGSGSDITTVNPLKFTPSNYNDQSLEIVKTIPGAAANDPSTYSINGETATSNPLYILDGGVSLNDKAAGSTDIKGYIDQKFQYFVAPNMPTVATGDLHDLKIDYYIEYLDNKAEKFSRTVRLDDNTFNFDEMLASYIYNINITISLDQIYITVDDVLWNSGPSTPADIDISGDEL